MSRRTQKSFLTKEADRLVALAGVAADYAASREWDASAYVASMWRETLELSLFWARDESVQESSLQLTSQYVAPSFSWASLARQVAFGWSAANRIAQVRRSYFRVTGVYLKYGSTDRLGLLREGSYLIVKGLVWKVQCDPINPPSTSMYWENFLQIGNRSEIHVIIRLDQTVWSAFGEDLFCITGEDDYIEQDSESTGSSKY